MIEHEREANHAKKAIHGNAMSCVRLAGLFGGFTQGE